MKLIRTYPKQFAVVVVLIVVTAASLLVIQRCENNAYTDEENTQTGYTAATDPIRYNGKWYIENEKLENTVIIGLDKYEDADTKGNYINDRQADFILLLTVDETNKTVKSLQINRDTMTEVKILGVGGKEAGNNIMQIALSHTYGSGGNDSCLNVKSAVSNLLYGIQIDHFISLTMDTVPKINDAFGGVTLVIPDDMTGIDPTWTQGSEVTLYGQAALNFVSARGSVVDSTNTARMSRQKTYINSLVNKAKAEYKANGNEIIYNLLFDISDSLTSDYSLYQMQSLCDKISEYDFSDIKQIDGETKTGEKYTEFYPDNDKLKEFVINNYFVESPTE